MEAYVRDNKNILRLFRRACNFPSIIYNTSENEHFGPFFDSVIFTDTYEQLIRTYAQRSVIAQLGYVDVGKLLDSYTYLRTHSLESRTAQERALLAIYMWLSAEIGISNALSHLI